MSASSMSYRAFKKSGIATLVAAAAVTGLSVMPAHAATPSHPAVASTAHYLHTFTLDNVHLSVTSTDIPSGTIATAAPGTGVQVATVSQDTPFRYFSVTAVPYGEQLPESVFPASKSGDVDTWRAALHGAQNGPVATIFGEKVKGVVSHSQGDLTGKKGSKTTIETIQWIVDQGGRTWVVNLQHDQSDLPGSFGTGLVVTSANDKARTTVDLARLDAAPKAGPASRIHANDVALGANLGQPSWWRSTCDGNGSLLNTQFMGLQVCNGGYSRVESVPGVGQYEWQCAELSDRYLVQRYGLSGAGGNGNQEAQNWYNAYPSKFDLYSNGSHNAPAPGDVISFNVGASGAGHTGVVYQTDVNSSGNGTVYFVDQNWAGDGGYNSASINNWNVSDITGEGGTVQWLHNPADSAAVTDPAQLASGTLVKSPDSATVKVIIAGAGLPLAASDVSADGYDLSKIVTVTDASFNALPSAPPAGTVVLDQSGTSASRYVVIDGAALPITGAEWTADGYNTRPAMGVPTSWLQQATAATLPSGTVVLDQSGTSASRYVMIGGAALPITGAEWTADGYSTRPAMGVPGTWLASAIANTIPSGTVVLDQSGTSASRYVMIGGAALPITGAEWTADGYNTRPAMGVPGTWLASAIANTIPNGTVVYDQAGTSANRYVMQNGTAVLITAAQWTADGYNKDPLLGVPGTWLASVTAPASSS